jgi:hypothetical protein
MQLFPTSRSHRKEVRIIRVLPQRVGELADLYLEQELGEEEYNDQDGELSNRPHKSVQIIPGKDTIRQRPGKNLENISFMLSNLGQMLYL